MDTIKITTNGIPLKSAALDPAGTIHGYRREDATVGHEGRKPNPGFVFPAKGPELLRVYTERFGPGDLRIHCYRANLPKFLYGHNGRLIQSPDDFLLALTRLRHVLKQLVDRQYWPFLLPNAEDPNNQAHLTYLESTWHVHDPNHVLLAAAMGARMPEHSMTPFLVPGETATIRGSTLALKFYDKVRQTGSQQLKNPEQYWTRLEATFKSPGRLHRSVFRDGQLPGAGAVRTITFDDAYGALRHEVGRLDGLWGKKKPDTDSPDWTRSDGKARDVLLKALVAVSVTEDISLHRILDTYSNWLMPSPKTRSSNRQTAHRLLAECRALDLDDYLPEVVPADPPEVSDGRTEQELRRTAAEWQWPTTPDADIVKAFSTTTELTPIPDREAMLAIPKTGMKWQQNDLR